MEASATRKMDCSPKADSSVVLTVGDGRPWGVPEELSRAMKDIDEQLTRLEAVASSHGAIDRGLGAYKEDSPGHFDELPETPIEDVEEPFAEPQRCASVERERGAPAGVASTEQEE